VPSRSPGRSLFDEKRRQPARAGAGPEYNAVHVPDVRVADEALAAVEHVVALITSRRTAHAEHMAAALGLGDRDRRQQLAVREAREPASLLALGAEVHDLRHPELGRLNHRAHGSAHARELLDHERLGQVAQVHAAIAPRDRHADPALLRDPARELDLDGAPLFHLPHPRPDLVLGEPPDVVTKRAMLGLEEVVHPFWEGSGPGSIPSGDRADRRARRQLEVQHAVADGVLTSTSATVAPRPTRQRPWQRHGAVLVPSTSQTAVMTSVFRRA
jgi:hypothetical protein